MHRTSNFSLDSTSSRRAPDVEDIRLFLQVLDLEDADRKKFELQEFQKIIGAKEFLIFLLERAVAKKEDALKIFTHFLKTNPVLIRTELDGNNFFHLAAEFNYPELLPVLNRASKVIPLRDPVTKINDTLPRINRINGDSKGNFLTPLMLALKNGHKEMALELVRNGADLWQKNAHEDTALNFVDDSRFRNKLRAVAYEAGKKKGFFSTYIDADFPSRLSPQDLNNMVKIVDENQNIFSAITKKKYLLDSSLFFRLMDLVEFDQRNKDKVVKVISAILIGNSQFPFLIGAEGRSDNLYHYAAKYDIPELVEIIRGAESKAYGLEKINHLNHQKLTPLMIAKEKGSDDMQKELQKFGAKENLPLQVEGGEQVSPPKRSRES